MNSTAEIISRIKTVEAQINTACLKADRDPKEIKLLLATKTIDPKTLQAVAESGYTCMGENKAQEFKEKVSLLKDLPIEWHFIGHLQTNKIKDILTHTHLLHSLDRISLAKELQKHLTLLNKNLNCLIEVNCSGEESKSGLHPDQLIDFAQEMKNYPNINVIGLMTIAKNSENQEELRADFKLCKTQFENLKERKFQHIKMKELSMGMSQDFEIAIEEGATLIRIGSAIFGERKY